jgi:protease IV
MRQFFKIVFATMTGIVLLFVLFIGIVVAIAGSAGKDKTAAVDTNSILKLDLNYNIPERTEDNPFAGLSLGELTPKKAVGLTEIRACIKKAKEDDNIKGIYLELGINNNGFAMIESIREALLDFRKSGKFVYAYGEVISQKAYYLATASDKIFLNPNGAMETPMEPWS